jgi:hypothetical protein
MAMSARLDAFAGRTVARITEGGILLWVVVTGGIWLWAFHLLFITIFTRQACYQPAWIWAMHACTAVTAAGTVAVGWASGEMVRRCHDDEAAGTVAGRTRFLGILAFLSNTISLALILLEGLYVGLFEACA